MEILPYFDSKKLNAKINRKDRIQYEKIIVDCSSTKEGLIHIIERHIYDVVEAYSRLVLNDQGSNYLESFMREQNLSQDFKLYAASLSRIAEELYQLRRFFFSDFRYEDFIKSFYGKIDTKDLKRFYVGREQQTFGCKVDELQNQLRTARKIISDEEKQKLYECLLEVCGLVSSDPDKIWKDGNEHVYVSTYRFGKNERMVMFVAHASGRLISAFKKSPVIKQIRGVTYIIYDKNSRRDRNI